MKEYPQPSSEFISRYLTTPAQQEVIRRRAIDLLTLAAQKDMIIFLDKTARPLVQLVYSGWPHLYPGENMPAIRFVNLGTEKNYPIEHYRLNSPVSFQNLDDLKNVFGTTEINQLQRTLASTQSQKRLVVEDCICSGKTLALAQKIFSLVDPTNQYQYMVFIDSSTDRSAFMTSSDQAIFMPWHSAFTLVADSDNDSSFISRLETSPFRRQGGLAVRSELRQLARHF